jgi:hypothetical protein
VASPSTPSIPQTQPRQSGTTTLTVTKGTNDC